MLTHFKTKYKSEQEFRCTENAIMAHDLFQFQKGVQLKTVELHKITCISHCGDFNWAGSRMLPRSNIFFLQIQSFKKGIPLSISMYRRQA